MFNKSKVVINLKALIKRSQVQDIAKEVVKEVVNPWKKLYLLRTAYIKPNRILNLIRRNLKQKYNINLSGHINKIIKLIKNLLMNIILLVIGNMETLKNSLILVERSF